jgi:hypothetical protein
MLDFLGNWTSIFGFILTFILAIIGYLIKNRIKEIQRNIQFDVRILNLIKQLEKSKSKYPMYLRNYNGTIKQIRYEMLQTEVILKNLKLKVTGMEKRSVKAILGRIWKMKFGNFINEIDRKRGIWIKIQSAFYKRLETSEDDLWNFYTELSALQTALENLIKDKNVKRYE